MGDAVLAWNGFWHMDEATRAEPISIRADPDVDGNDGHDSESDELIRERV
jgi:hypothetical protein